MRFPRQGPGYTNADVRSLAREIGGEGMKGVFDSLVNGTGSIDWERVLAYAGLELVASDAAPGVWTGMDFSEYGGRVRITRVIAGSPSYVAGLDIGDEVVAMDGVRITASGLGQRLKDFSPGGTIRLTVFRNDRLRDFTVKLEKPRVTPYRVRQMENTTPEQKAILESWLPGGGA
jgi:predicted metalloprotease with PDZ domain